MDPMMMIAFITFNGSLVPLIEDECSSNPLELKFSCFRRNQTNNLGINSPSLWPAEPHLHVRFFLPACVPWDHQAEHSND